MSLRPTHLTVVAALACPALAPPASSAAEKFAIFDDRIPVRQIAVERNANDGGYLVVAARDPSFDHSGRRIEARRIPRSLGYCRVLLPGGGSDGVAGLDCRTAVEERRAGPGPVVRVSDDTLLWGPPELSFSSDAGVYLLVYVATIKGRPDGPFGRILSADGEPLSEEFRISPEDGCRSDDVFGVAYSELTGRWLVAWRGSGASRDSGAARGCGRVRARFVRTNGVLGRDVPVFGPGNIESGGDLAYSVDRSEFLIVWSEGIDTSAIVGRVIRERESRNSKRLFFAEADEDCLLVPRAAGGSQGGGFLVTWVNRCDGEIPVASLDSRLLEADGLMKRVSRYRTGEVADPGDLAFSEPAGRYVAVWDESKPGTISAERVGVSRVFRGGGRPLARARTLGAQAMIIRASCSARRTECLAVWVRRDSDRAIAGWVDPKKHGSRP